MSTGPTNYDWSNRKVPEGVCEDWNERFPAETVNDIATESVWSAGAISKHVHGRCHHNTADVDAAVVPVLTDLVVETEVSDGTQSVYSDRVAGRIDFEVDTVERVLASMADDKAWADNPVVGVDRSVSVDGEWLVTRHDGRAE